MSPRDVQEVTQSVLSRAVNWSPEVQWEQLDQCYLSELTTEHGIDFATAVYYDRLRNSPHHSPFIRHIDALSGQPRPSTSNVEPVVAIVPGAFYRQFPHVGADGAIVSEVARKLQFDTRFVATDSLGMPEANGAFVADWIANQESQHIILVSVCSGAASVLNAFEQLRDSSCLQKVAAWVNICGLVQGTPLSNWAHASRLRKLTYRAMMRLQGLSFELVSRLCWQPDGASHTHLPRHVLSVHVQGIPLNDDMTNRLTRLCRQRIAPWGPNDGILLLSDTMSLPGFIYPVWGADHYMRPSWRMKQIVARLLEGVMSPLKQSPRNVSPCPGSIVLGGT